MYLIAGVVAIVAAIYFIATAPAGDSFGILDYAILGMGVVAIYRGVRGFLALRNGSGGSTGAPGGNPGPTRINKPGSRSSDDSDKGGPAAS